MVACLPFGVPTWAGGRALWGFRTCQRLLWSCVPSFRPLSCFALGVLLADMALFRVLRAFLARFGVVVRACVVLVLCVACVALYACGVRRIKGLLRVCFSFYPFCPFAYLLLPFVLSLCSCFCPFVLVFLCLLSFACSLALSFLSCFVCSFFFPYGLYAKRKGRNSLRPLFVCCVLVYMFSASLSVASFAFENIHPAPQER